MILHGSNFMPEPMVIFIPAPLFARVKSREKFRVSRTVVELIHARDGIAYFYFYVVQKTMVSTKPQRFELIEHESY